MNRRTIEVNFQAAMASANELDGIAGDLERALRNGYAESMSRLAGNWSGENAAFYQTKGGKLTEQIQDTVSRIRAAAEEVRRTARLIHNAELAALAIANARSY